MPVQIYWDDPQHNVVRMTIEGKWDLFDFHAAMDRVASLQHHLRRRMDVIVDFTSAEQSRPMNLLSVYRRLERRLPSEWGQTLLVRAPAYIRATCALAGRMIPAISAGTDFVNSLEEAYARLRQGSWRDTRSARF
jgi:hypothetical protein